MRFLEFDKKINEHHVWFISLSKPNICVKLILISDRKVCNRQVKAVADAGIWISHVHFEIEAALKSGWPLLIVNLSFSCVFLGLFR